MVLWTPISNAVSFNRHSSNPNKQSTLLNFYATKIDNKFQFHQCLYIFSDQLEFEHNSTPKKGEIEIIWGPYYDGLQVDI